MPEAAKSSSYSFQHPQSRTVKKKETESPVIRTIGSSFLPKKQEEQQNPETVKSPEIDYSKFIEEGIYRYKPLKNSSTLGIEYLSDYSTSSRALQLQSTARITATIGSIGLSAMAILGLVSSGIKLILSTLFGIGNEEEAFENLGSAYKKSSVAGILTGLAHENPLWAVGNGLMGLAGKLDNVFKLAFFTIGDGLSSIGMGQVRFKEKGNAFAIKKSIFDNKNLSYLSFLKPIEHSIYSFAKRFSTANGWKLFQQAEPYALYNDAGGGLVTGGGGALVIAGGALAAAKMFGNTLSEGFQSFSYLPASIFSLVNLMAFYRDGAVQVDRSHYIGGGKKKSEKITQRIEGYLKQAATPFLGFRNLSFAAKGIGLDTGGIFHKVGVAGQALGAAFAFSSFIFQLSQKFLKPELFGAKFKQTIEAVLKLKAHAKELKDTREYLKRPDVRAIYEVKNEMANQLKDVVLNDKHSSVLTKIMETADFQGMYGKSQAGFPVPGNEKTYSRFYENRGEHLVSTCGTGIKLFDRIMENTSERELKDFLLKNELPFRIACLLHDIGHGPFSHVLDKALPGYDNDHETIKMIRDEKSELHKAILKICNDAGFDGKEVIKDVLHILGRYSSLYPLLSGWGADRIEYIRMSDFPLVNNGRVLFPKWDMSDIEHYANTFNLIKDKNGKEKIVHTPEGALIAFLMCSDRGLFNRNINTKPDSFMTDLLAAIGLSECSPKDIVGRTEDEVFEIIFKNIEKLEKGEITVNAKVFEGGRNAYSYYSSIPEDPTSIHIKNGIVKEFLSYVEDKGIKHYLEELHNTSEWFKKYPITEQELKSRIKAATTLHEFYYRIHARSEN